MKFLQQGTNKIKKGYKKTTRRRRKLFSLRSLSPMRTETANNNTRVVRIPHFLSKSDIQTILSVVSELDLPAYTNNGDDDINEHGQPVHVTSYLNTENNFETRFPWVAQRVRKAISQVNAKEKWGFQLETGKVNIRVAEYHEMYPEGSLSGMDHCDIGSLITVDIMLQEGLSGGVFQTVDNHSHTTSHHSFLQGDALVFVSHKYHRVTPLRRGVQKVLVVEFWSGEARECGHRCDVPRGECCFDSI
jgi:hypothetical protein